jgi:hypothetical protein
MNEAVRQQVVVGAGGEIIIHVPQLKAGTRAEVIVLEQPNSATTGEVFQIPLSSLIGSCRGMFSTPDEADDFLRRERDAWD